VKKTVTKEVNSLKVKNFCYKSILLEDGIALLFEEFSDFKEEDIKINHFNNDLYVEFGDNIFLLTKNMIEKLLKKPKLFISIGDFNDYEAFGYIGHFEVDTDLLAQIKGAVLVIETQEKNQNISSLDTSDKNRELEEENLEEKVGEIAGQT